MHIEDYLSDARIIDLPTGLGLSLSLTAIVGVASGPQDAEEHEPYIDKSNFVNHMLHVWLCLHWLMRSHWVQRVQWSKPSQILKRAFTTAAPRPVNVDETFGSILSRWRQQFLDN